VPYAEGDSDGDGTSDQLEFAIGSDPATPDCVMRHVT
jgi:hypothetical protein